MKKKKTTNNKELNKKFLAKVKPINKDQHIQDIYLGLLRGKNSYLRMRRLESSVFDSSWIEVVEGVLFDLGEIVANPRQVTKQESYIVPIELAKKTDGESVQHLASHTQYIKEIDEHGNVVPSKILSHSNEDNLFTYENRFIATFIRRLVLFIEKRYDFIQNMIPLHVEDVMYIKNKSLVNGEEVEIETKIKVKKESQDDLAYEARGFVERIEKMREYIFYYYNSPFMRKMKNEKDVRKPILQTNIIRKNLKYHHCFEVFTFIEKFESLGVNYHVTEDYKIFNEQELADINFLFLSEYLAINGEDEFSEVKSSAKEYKPKILTSIDDEIFTFGPPLTGTLEFVRVDEPYRNYLNRMQDVHDLPLHPDKYEKLYYKDEYLYKKMYKEKFEEIEKLLRRKVRERENYEALVQQILKQVAEEERQAEEARLRAIIEDEYRRIEQKRKEMMEIANREHDLQIQREKERIERQKRLEEERLRREALEAEKERLAKEAEAEKERLEQLEEERRAEERRIAHEVLIARQALKERQEEIIEQIYIEKEVAKAKEDIKNQEMQILEHLRIEKENERRRLEEEVQQAKDEIQKEEMRMLEEYNLNKARQSIVEQEKKLLSHANGDSDSSPIEDESAPATESTPASEEESTAETSTSEEPTAEDAQLSEEEDAKLKHRRQIKTHVVSINGKKVNAYMIISEDEEEAENRKTKEKAKVAPAKKEEAPAKKEPISPFGGISKKTVGFVLQTKNGYYVSDDNFVMHKKDAKVFASKELAEEVRAKFGGKVVKL